MNTPTVAIINVYGHTFHTSAACPVVAKHRAKVRFMPQRDATLYFGMVEGDCCRSIAKRNAA